MNGSHSTQYTSHPATHSQFTISDTIELANSNSHDSPPPKSFITRCKHWTSSQAKRVIFVLLLASNGVVRGVAHTLSNARCSITESYNPSVNTLSFSNSSYTSSSFRDLYREVTYLWWLQKQCHPRLALHLQRSFQPCRRGHRRSCRRCQLRLNTSISMSDRRERVWYRGS